MNEMGGRKGGYEPKTWERVDKELYWSGLLVTMKLEGKQGPNRTVTDIKLYPADLRGDLPRAQRGRPLLAKGTVAQKVLNVMVNQSAKYGTEITIKDDVGIVKL
jgi:poly-gamma-glutamate synthesis protein (capsule biosynthesis protein)